jgi:hypothetical protein
LERGEKGRLRELERTEEEGSWRGWKIGGDEHF